MPPTVGFVPFGYCFTKEKADKMVTEGLKRTLERKYGVVLVALDPGRPISEQEVRGEAFRAIIHKVRGHPDLNRHLFEYARKNPECLLLDRPSCIQVLDDRHATFAKLFRGDADEREGSGRQAEGTAANRIQRGRLCIHLTSPRQAAISLATLERQQQQQEEELPESLGGFTLVAKPKASGKHSLYLIQGAGGLRSLRERCEETEVVVQEYINHSGVILKAYNFGKQVQCEARHSFGDIQHLDLDTSGRRTREEEVVEGLKVLKSVSGEKVSMDVLVKSTGLQLDELEGVAKEACHFVRQRLQLTMFNVDLAFQNQQPPSSSGSTNESHQPLLVHVLDVNYMPGYHKLSNYEELFGQFVGGELLHPSTASDDAI